MITSAPAGTSAARKASSSASVPLATPTQCATPVKAAYSRSKADTTSPLMKAALLMSSSKPTWISAAT